MLQNLCLDCQVACDGRLRPQADNLDWEEGFAVRGLCINTENVQDAGFHHLEFC